MWKRKETWDGILRAAGAVLAATIAGGQAPLAGAEGGRRTVPERLRERGAVLCAHAGHPARRDTQGGLMSAELDHERWVLPLPGEAAMARVPSRAGS